MTTTTVLLSSGPDTAAAVDGALPSLAATEVAEESRRRRPCWPWRSAVADAGGMERGAAGAHGEFQVRFRREHAHKHDRTKSWCGPGRPTPRFQSAWHAQAMPSLSRCCPFPSSLVLSLAGRPTHPAPPRPSSSRRRTPEPRQRRSAGAQPCWPPVRARVCGRCGGGAGGTTGQSRELQRVVGCRWGQGVQSGGAGREPQVQGRRGTARGMGVGRLRLVGEGVGGRGGFCSVREGAGR